MSVVHFDNKNVVWKIVACLLASLLAIPILTYAEAKKSEPNDQLVFITLSTRLLQLFEKGELIAEFPIRIGKYWTPTPLGEGYLYEKRIRAIFRYVDPGPKRGQVIYMAECTNGLIPVNYKKMRALGIRMDGTKDRYSIHSTTCSETIGKAISSGCIGMTIPDMLKLYPLVKEGARIKIVYVWEFD